MPSREARLDAIRETAARARDAHAETPSSQPVPVAGYYDRPLLKPPVWTWEIPSYFYVGGAVGAVAVVGCVARVVAGETAVSSHARIIAVAGVAISVLLLISDLGRPARFLNMLRIVKWQSPMSVGAWTLTMFGGASILSVALDVLWPGGRPLLLGLMLDVVTGATGLVLASYASVLIGATAIPVWSAHARLLPLHFGASALGAAVSLIELTGVRTTPLNRIGIGAATIETVMGLVLEARRRGAARSLFAPDVARLTRGGAMLSGPIPLAIRIFGAEVPGLRIVAALSTTAGSLSTRFAWIGAGRHSASEMPPASRGRQS
jgi:hypothetical protein